MEWIQVKMPQRKTASRSVAAPPERPAWTFLSNHSHVLICLADDPQVRLRDVASRVGITERAVQKIVAELEEAGVMSRHKEGRRNRYAIDVNVALRHPIEAHRTVGDLLKAVR